MPGLHEGEAVKVFDCFSGFGGDPAHSDHGGWGNAARARGHEVVTLDYEARFNADIVADIREVTAADLPWRPDVVLASPPCEAFSVARIGVNWNHDHTPKTDRARLGLEILEPWAIVEITAGMHAKEIQRFLTLRDMEAALAAIGTPDVIQAGGNAGQVHQ